MKSKVSIVGFVLFFVFILCNYAQQDNFPVLKGPYLGQKPPGKTPEVFAPGIISTDITEGCSGWGNHMEYFIFQRWINRKPKLYLMNQVDGTWSRPLLLPFVEKYQIGDFTIAPDGKNLEENINSCFIVALHRYNGNFSSTGEIKSLSNTQRTLSRSKATGDDT